MHSLTDDQPRETLFAALGSVRSAGYLLIAVFVATLISWATVVPVTQAILASGTVEASNLTVQLQHQDDGVLDEMRVLEGDSVEQGEVVAVMDTSKLILQRNATRRLLVSLQLEKLRLQQGLGDGSALEVSPALEAEIGALDMSDALEVEQRQLALNQDAYVREMRALQVQLQGLAETTARLTERLGFETKQIRSAQSVAESFESLRAGGRIKATELERVQQTYLGLQAQAAETHADLAQAELALNEASTDLVRLPTERRAQQTARLAELGRQIIAQQMILARTEIDISAAQITSPVRGIVQDIAYASRGASVPKNRTLVRIVPDDSQPVIGLRIRPKDIDRIRPGTVARIALSAYPEEAVGRISATVVRVSADAAQQEGTNRPFYRAILELDAGDIARAQQMANTPFELRPGMPVDAQIAAGSQTFLTYLMTPLRQAMDRSFRS